MSITLSIPPVIVQEIRAWAEENGTSLNQYIRDCLEAKVNELAAMRRNRADQFETLCLVPLGTVPRRLRSGTVPGRFPGRFVSLREP